ncbi:MAG: hypothetical protein IKQ17_05860 [Kiritimatiellae bacterium]|nr:hypothetical protein [Kiritimatiellia bacterium]
MEGCTIMFDRDVAKMFGISVRTLQRRMEKPVAGELDLNDAGPETVGGRRFWLREEIVRVVRTGIKARRSK